MAPEQPTIKVRRHSEAERVIYAGAPAASAPATDGPAKADELSSEEEARSSVDGAQRSAADSPSAKAGPYRETTLDDIESSTMSGLQKGIIIGAVLLIAACIAWYVLFMS